MPAAVHESAILKKLDAAGKAREDEWPEFPLTDVTVYNRETKQPFSLLSAYTGDPAYIEGTLVEKDSPNKDRHKKRGFGKTRISVEDVSVYSYGLNDDSSLSFWAAGDAGWFELRGVSKDYQSIYEEMEEATSLLYYLTDKISKQRVVLNKKTSMKVVDEHVTNVFRLLRKSSEFNKGKRQGGIECRKAFVMHRFFLIKCMLESAEGIDWKSTAFFRWFNVNYTKDVQFMIGVVRHTAKGPIPIAGPDESAPDGLTKDEIMTEDIEEDSGPQEEESTIRREDNGPQEEEAGIKIRRRPNFRIGQPSTPPVVNFAGGAGRITRRQAAQDAIDSEGDLDGRHGRDRRRHKRKSLLRPFGSSKTPKKSTTERNGLRVYKKPTIDEIREGRMELDEEDITDSEDERIVKEALENETPTRVKRLGLDEDDDDDKDEDGDEEMVNEAAQGDNGSLRLQPNKEYYEPKGPDNTWTCPYDGCNHKVWDSRSSLGVSLIQEHYAENHKDSIEDLIKSEARPWAHVENLLAKIQGFPKPVSRKY